MLYYFVLCIVICNELFSYRIRKVGDQKKKMISMLPDPLYGFIIFIVSNYGNT